MNHERHLRIESLARACTLAAIAAAASIGAARAEEPGHDWKGYPGVNCIGQNQNDPLRRSAVAQTAISNTGTSPVTVFCPVVRDESAGGQTRIHEVAVRFRNRNSTASGRCELSSHDINGSKIATQTLVAPFGETTLRFGPMNASNWGSYVLQCQIPGRDPATSLQSYVVNYRVDELLP
jgi:hypothetical protein